LRDVIAYRLQHKANTLFRKAKRRRTSMSNVTRIPVIDISAENFKSFGQLVVPDDDGAAFHPSKDAELQLDQGTPRFYIMRLPRRGRRFNRITFHAKVTQCLGALAPVQPWFLVVAAPTMDVERWPSVEDLKAFRIPHGVYIKLHAGTWHAGPLFDGDAEMDFYNLELADTNVVDHNAHCYSDEFEVVD
jgi:hypothetical protein